MRIVCIADTHALDLSDYHIPDGDVLIHAGDFTNVGQVKDVIAFSNWLGTQPHKHKIVIAGNHDFSFDSTHYKEDIDGSYYLTDCIYLFDSSVTIDGVVFYGSPWTPYFGGWAFNLREQALEDKWSDIECDVLITHGPAHGVLDECQDGYRAGCKHLAKRIQELDCYHICGHIHEAYGRQGKSINASSVNEYYELVNSPIVLDI